MTYDPLITNPAQIFSYDLPPDRIAQRPVYPYDQAKLLVIDRKNNSIQDSRFTRITDFLQPSDILVFNDTRVIPARIFGKTQHGGEIEILRLRSVNDLAWWCIGRPMKKFHVGTVLDLGSGLTANVIERNESDEVLLRFSDPSLLDSQGVMPIPPYIRDGRGDNQDRLDYQSNFAAHSGSVAAPTASLHFTPELLKSIAAHGCQVEKITLHVGPASFLPLWRPDQTDSITPPGVERYNYSPKLKSLITSARRAGRRVIAVGTTVVRALESMAENTSTIEKEVDTKLFISPGFSFKMVDAMITNFHQPQSTHLLLVESFLGRALLEASYKHAMSHAYRFLSYGDGMLII